jgi:hypothetical protein
MHLEGLDRHKSTLLLLAAQKRGEHPARSPAASSAAMKEQVRG